MGSVGAAASGRVRSGLPMSGPKRGVPAAPDVLVGVGRAAHGRGLKYAPAGRTIPPPGSPLLR